MTLLRRLLLVVASVVLVSLLVVAFELVSGGAGLGVTPTGAPVEAGVCFPANGSSAVEPGASRSSKEACRSPDAQWLASMTSSNEGCSIYLTRVSTGRRARMYGPGNAGCTQVAWGGPHQLLFTDGESSFYTLNPASRYPLTRPAAFAEFVVSPNRRWVAGDAANGAPEAPPTAVYLLTPDASTCLMVPLGPHRTDQVVGFTRDSKSLIVSSAPWNGTSSPLGNTRLRQFRLSSLHTNCNGSELGG